MKCDGMMVAVAQQVAQVCALAGVKMGTNNFHPLLFNPQSQVCVAATSHSFLQNQQEPYRR
jgi:hypothetical protein